MDTNSALHVRNSHPSLVSWHYPRFPLVAISVAPGDDLEDDHWEVLQNLRQVAANARRTDPGAMCYFYCALERYITSPCPYWGPHSKA